VLERTLGVPIFQEQVMQLAIVAAGFTPARPTSCAAPWPPGGARAGSGRSRTSSSRACARAATKRSSRGASSQILGFGEYGFPESHAASFALLVYVSAWLKCH
jgi:error-prone DNA polymerase